METFNHPQVSVIIINYNTFLLTCAAIESLFSLTKGVTYEIIVVDNASTECKPELFLEKFQTIKLVKSFENVGFSKGNNLGIKHAIGECILLLNSDTVLINDALSITYHKLLSRKDTGIVGAQLMYPNGLLQRSAQRFPEVKYLFFELFRLQKLVSKKKAGKFLLGSFFDHNIEVEADWIWGTFFLFKKELLQKFQNAQLPDTFFMYNEDLQWCIEARRYGYKTLYVPDAKVVHYEGSNNFKNEMATNNFNTIMKMYYGNMYYNIFRCIRRLVKLSSFKND